MQNGAVWAAGVAEGGFIKRAVERGETTEEVAARYIFRRHVQTARLLGASVQAAG